jgi:probable rRNA maturation factor
VTVVTGNRIESGLAASLQRFMKRVQKEIGLRGDVTVLLTSSNEMRKLNRRFRNKDKATDVLSFPAPAAIGGDGLGDIAISIPVARAQARRMGHSFEEELKVLLLHGLLHLAGYDHETDQGQMRRKEQRLRTRLAVPTSLTERGTNHGSRSHRL